MTVPPTRSIMLATEGSDDLAVAERLVLHAGFEVGLGPGQHDGAPALDAALPAYCKAAAHGPWLVLRDLDRGECALGLVHEIAPRRPPTMLLRIVVRAIQSWFFADPESLAQYLAIAVSKVPRDPDSDSWPKRTMVGLARRSRSKDVKLDMVPPEGAKRYYGAAYTSRMVAYARHHWRPDVARRKSASLDRAVRALQRLRSAEE
jgi:hypothetical protein